MHVRVQISFTTSSFYYPMGISLVVHVKFARIAFEFYAKKHNEQEILCRTREVRFETRKRERYRGLCTVRQVDFRLLKKNVNEVGYKLLKLYWPSR